MRTLYIATFAALTLAACGSSADTSTHEQTVAESTTPQCPCPVALPPVVQPSSTPQPSFVPVPDTGNEPQNAPTVDSNSVDTRPSEANTTLPFAPQSTPTPEPTIAPTPTPTPTPSATPSCRQVLADGSYDLTCGVYVIAGNGQPRGCPDYAAGLFTYDPNHYTVSSTGVVTSVSETLYPQGIGYLPTDVFANGRYGAQTILNCQLTITPAPND